MIGFIIAVSCYVLFSVAIAFLARQMVDPYDHASNRSDWTQAMLIGAFWPFMLVYVVGVAIYYSWINPPR